MASWFLAYLNRTRQPWACVAFVLPLLIAYEVGLFFLSTVPDDLRTGADSWLRHALASYGVLPMAAPVILAVGLMTWAWLAGGGWEDPVGTWIGMVVESASFAGVFFGLVQLAFPILKDAGGFIQQTLGRYLDVMPPGSIEMTWTTILRFIGAGIFEETIFRLIGLSLLRLLFLAGDLRPRWANVLAAIGSSVLFAAAHHLGSGNDHIDATVFLYRFGAGLYFACLFQTRGYAIAVGAHAGYDVLVGLILR